MQSMDGVNHVKMSNEWLKYSSSANEKINDFVQEMRLKINCYNDIIFEWIPYDYFESIEEIGEYGFATAYSAKWTIGPLYYDKYNHRYKRSTIISEKVVLKRLHNSQNIPDSFLN